jgi:hypothetical protein
VSLVLDLLRSYRRHGARGTLYRGANYLFGLVRPSLPRGRRVSFNSVEVNVHRRPLDGLFPMAAKQARAYDQPAYDSGLVDAVRETVDAGDTVVIVGGGFGVTTVAAARQVGEEGIVLTYEAATERVVDIREALRHHDLEDRVAVLHAVVERAVHTLGGVGDAPTVPARMLPSCDVLVLDCDGCEVSILRDLVIAPRTLVVGTASRFGSSESTVREALDDLRYRVVSREITNEENPEFCLENGYYALTALREDRARRSALEPVRGTDGSGPSRGE